MLADDGTKQDSQWKNVVYDQAYSSYCYLK
jgi:hypothetical protein